MKRLLTLLVVLAAPAVLAEDLEVAAVVGYTTSGALDHAALGITDLKLDGSFTWGASAACFFSTRFGVEASWARQESALVIGTSAGSATLFDVHLDQLQGTFVFRLGRPESQLRPFLTAGVGAAFLGANDLEGETKLSFGLGAGLKWFPTKHLGARLQARYTPTHLDDASSDFCDPFGFCQGWLQQVDVTGGLVFRF